MAQCDSQSYIFKMINMMPQNVLKSNCHVRVKYAILQAEFNSGPGEKNYLRKHVLYILLFW